MITQTLFNPSYFGHELLSAVYIPVLGIGAWWTMFVLTLQAVYEQNRARYGAKYTLTTVPAFIEFAVTKIQKNERRNGLIRRFIPKGKSIREFLYTYLLDAYDRPDHVVLMYFILLDNKLPAVENHHVSSLGFP